MRIEIQQRPGTLTRENLGSLEETIDHNTGEVRGDGSVVTLTRAGARINYDVRLVMAGINVEKVERDGDVFNIFDAENKRMGSIEFNGTSPIAKYVENPAYNQR